MMSYLWILLLGSLLAASAKAQDPVPEAKVEPGADEDTTEQSAEETSPVVNEPEPKGGHEADTDKPGHVEETADTKSESEAAADGDQARGTDETQDAPLSPDAAAPEAGEVPEGDEDTADHSAEVISPVANEPEAKNGLKSDGPVNEGTETGAPLPGDTQAAGSEPENEEAAGGKDPAGPAPGETDASEPENAKEGIPVAGDIDSAPSIPEDTEAGGGTKPEANVDGNKEPRMPNQEQDPAVVPGVKEEEAEAEGEEEATNVKEVPVQEETQNTPDKEEEQTNPDADPADVLIIPDMLKPEVKTEVNADNPPAVGSPIRPEPDGTSEIEPHVAGATGEAAENTETKETNSSTLAGILSAIIVAAVASVVGYFMYQQKKLCFKNRQDADPEAARKADAAEAQSDPQVLSNLLNTPEASKDNQTA